MDKLKIRFMLMVLRMLYLLVKDNRDMNPIFSAEYVKLTMDLGEELHKDKVYNEEG